MHSVRIVPDDRKLVTRFGNSLLEGRHPAPVVSANDHQRSRPMIGWNTRRLGRTPSPDGSGWFGKSLRAFGRDESGGLVIFVLVLFVLLLVAGGMAVDFQRHEMLRADLQDALDRGVLAAANGNQNYDAASELSFDTQALNLVRQYMDSQNYTLGTQNLDVTVTEISGGRRVSATAGLQAPTIFLSLIGLKTMDVSARSAAIQSAGKIEITLVLDVSGSMGWDSTSAEGTKLAQLKIAAKDFIDTVLAGDNTTQILIAIVPFSQQVALPRAMADLYNLNRHHDYSSCFDYHSIDFGTRAMPTNPATAYDQGQHFRENVGSGNFGCPKINNIITPFSNNPIALKAAIEALSPETWTATYMGMKWGTHLLDPSSRPVVNALIASNSLPNTFAGWPHAWDDTSVRKITVLMSDGQNTRLNEIVDAVYVQETPDYWNSNNPASGEKVSIINSQATGEGDVILDQICTQAKLGVNATIYTVGFELGNQPVARAALEACSSALSTHYLVEGSEIQTAFQNIAGEIVDLKLIN